MADTSHWLEGSGGSGSDRNPFGRDWEAEKGDAEERHARPQCVSCGCGCWHGALG
jgi:hypothetical protein